MTDQVEQLLKRFERAMERKEMWRSMLDDAYFYSIPNRNPWDMSNRGSDMDNDLYDMTLANDMTKFVNQTISALTPPEVNWLKLIPGTYVPESEYDVVSQALQEDTDQLFYWLGRSNFDTVIQEAYEDMAISTGVLQVLEGPDDDPLNFVSVPNDRIGFETDAFGDLSGFLMGYQNLDIDKAHQIWGDKITIPEQVLQRKPPIQMNIAELTYYCMKDKTYKHHVIEKDCKEIMLYKEMKSWPWIGFRWERRAGEDRGRGPALKAYKTQATINRALADELRTAALAANPPFMGYHDYVINPWNFRIEPNTFIPVKPTGSETWPIQQLTTTSNLQFSAIVINDLRSQIHEIMFTQPLQPLQNDPVRTATEVAIKQAELRDNRGAAYARVQRELLLPLVKRVLFILAKKAKMRPIEIDGKQVDVSFKTPLSISKDSDKVRTFVEYFQILSAMYTPAVALSMIESVKFPRWAANKLNAELSMVKQEVELQQLVDQAKEAALGAIDEQQPGPQQLPPPIV